MTFVGILMLVLGLGFGILGYLIAFRGKYALINNFVDDRHRGKFDTAFARRTGLLELAWGFLSVLFGVLVLCIRSATFTWIAFCTVVLGTVLSLVLNTLLSIKKNR